MTTRQNTTLTRRGLLQAAMAAAAAPAFVPASALGAEGTSPSERITIAMVGTGGMNGGHLGGLLGNSAAQVIAMCDPQKPRREAAKQQAENAYAARRRDDSFKGVGDYNDYRELLARSDLDAVFIATPDHWHAPIAIAAAKAGKDIYCEKPMTNTHAAGLALIAAVRRYARVLQVGQQQRSDGRFRLACELVRNGRIGKLHTIRVEVPGGRDSGKMPPMGMPVPEGIDYDLWLGGAPWKPYCLERLQNVNWWHMSDYGIGFQAGWGVHHADIAQWGNGTDDSGPVEVEGKAVFPRDGLCDTPVTWDTLFTYANGVKLYFKSGGENVRFEGSEGTIDVSRSRIDATPKSILQSKIGPSEIHLYRSDNHHVNFLDCIRTRRDPIVPVETGHRSNTICILSDISIRFGRKLRWDPAKEQFAEDADANRMLARAMRSPWRL